MMHLKFILNGQSIGEEAKSSNQIHEESHHHHHEVVHSTLSPHMDNSILVFFTLKDLKPGNIIPIFFRPTTKQPSPSSSPHFLPREEANSIPFSLSKLPYLLQLFGFSQTSPQAQAMENTLRHCEIKPILGETKSCATSLESMLDFVHQVFGSNTKFKALSTHEFGKNNGLLQNYTILGEPREILAPKMVACHTMPYPYVVYYCHHQKSESKVFQVSLMGNNNIIVEAIAVCHLDTSQWSPNHVSFRVLGIKPGSSSPVCHFFPADNLVWVPVYETHQEGSSRDEVFSM
ncbi:BURP domain-containing protein BNM2A [Bienertia sinuspersici]